MSVVLAVEEMRDLVQMVCFHFIIERQNIWNFFSGKTVKCFKFLFSKKIFYLMKLKCFPMTNFCRFFQLLKENYLIDVVQLIEMFF